MRSRQRFTFAYASLPNSAGVSDCDGPGVGASAFPAGTGGLFIRSTTVTPRASASFFAVDGLKGAPFSIRLIVASVMPESAARVDWVSPWASRHSRRSGVFTLFSSPLYLHHPYT